MLLALVAAQSVGAAAPRREHGTHGTVRRLCEDAQVKRWPGGPLVGVVKRGRDMRRYAYRGHWALGVSHGVPHYYGYVQTERFCPASAAGRRALRRDRRPSELPARRSGTTLARGLARRICVSHVWLRDRPLDRAIGILWLGDVFVARRSARNPWFGGHGKGHERRRGWVPRAALCGQLPRQPAGFAIVEQAGGTKLLTAPAQLPCATAQPRRGLIEVGVDFARRRGAAVRADLVVGGRVRRGPTFRPGQARSLRRGAVGPFVCGRGAEIVYSSVGAGARVLQRTAVHIGPDGARPARAGAAASVRFVARAAVLGAARTSIAARASPEHAARSTTAPASSQLSARSAAEPTSATARTPSTRCASKPTLRFAHGREGPVSHRYDARPALSANGSAIAFDTLLRLTGADRDRASDVYLRTAAGLRLLSAGTRTSRAPAISADGRIVAFESDDPAPTTTGSVMSSSSTAPARRGSSAAHPAAPPRPAAQPRAVAQRRRTPARLRVDRHRPRRARAAPGHLPRGSRDRRDPSRDRERVPAGAVGRRQALVFESSHAYVASDRNRR